MTNTLSNTSSSNMSPLLLDVFKPNSILKYSVLTTAGACLFGLSSNISIPLDPVPFTFQSMIVLLLGATLGRKLGLIAMLQTVLMGLVGLPMFANGSDTFAAFASPSAGYIVGFFASVYMAGWAAEKGLDRHFLLGVLSFAIAHQVIFMVGVLYLSVYLNVSLKIAFNLGYLPFAGFDVLKFMSAAGLMYMIWKTRSQ